MKPGLLFFAALFGSFRLFSQDSVAYPRPGIYKRVQSTDLLFGFHWQGNESERKTIRYGEIGVAKTVYADHYHGRTVGSLYASEEVHLGGGKNIYGTKLAAFVHLLFDIGLAAVYYTDFERGNFKIRPEFGLGIGRFRAVMGYNIATINNRAFKDLQTNRMQFSLQYMIALHEKILK